MNFNQSKAAKAQLNKYSRWQYLTIFLTLIIMILSALPNLYQGQKAITLIPMHEQASPINAVNLKQQLTMAGFTVQAIKTYDQNSQIVLAEQQQSDAARQLLKHQFDGQYQAKLTLENTTPKWLKNLGGEPIKLGLDLQGGVLFVLDVDIEQAFNEKAEHIIQSVKKALRDHKMRGVKVVIDAHKKINITAPGDMALTSLIDDIRQQFPSITIQHYGQQKLVISYSEAEKLVFHQEVMLQTLTTMRGRIEELGITEAVVQRQGTNRIRIELPGTNNPEEARGIIGATASLDFYQLQEHGGKVFRDKSGQIVQVNPKPIFTGDHIKHAQAGRDEMGMPLVNLTLDSLGGEKMQRFSANNIGKPMVTVFSEYHKNADSEVIKNSEVINVANILTTLGSVFSITNMSSHQAANELALLLRAGSLVAPVTITKEQSINATLGEANIQNGVAALMLGIGLTLLFMALWYRRLGVIANVALFLNLVCILGLMSLLPGIVLTLPGIAGLVLTVGMAVDTNVLIFERIKEERKRGRTIAVAVDKGYKNAFATILDANVTTLLTALILYSIGYGPVKGFAITLGLGILTSMFTGVFISRALTNLFYARTQSRNSPQTSTKQIENNQNSNSRTKKHQGAAS